MDVERLQEALKDFEKRGKKEVCPVLDQFLCHVAKTGETINERKKKKLLRGVQERNRGRLLGPKSYCFLQREDVEYSIGLKMAN
uniref:Protein phosphatase 4 regulatory subunit 2 n=1 Tax=Pipistrellus kuhlii TaxID=59472 RepID=A0A7J7R7D0_PIPKU|nr:protein phosphatase 4 regulatory subunit 2 [Pipistrellus kuhlii]